MTRMVETTADGEPRAPSPAARGSNQSGMRAYNERLVLTLVREAGALSKAEIARLTGLSAQTVSVIMRGLEADGLLKKGEPVRGKVGQPLVPMRLDKTGAFFLGLKIGRRSLELVLTDFTGTVVDRIRVTHRYPTPDSVVSFVDTSLPHLLAQLPSSAQSRVAGMGIAMPYRLWDWAEALGVDPSQLADWRNRDIAAEISRHWGYPVYLENDASAACNAELVFGDRTKPRDSLYFFVGFFIGGGLVLDNALFTGRTGNAAALGSMPVGTEDGRARQLVSVASLSGLEQALTAKGEDGTVIWESPVEWPIAADALEYWLTRASRGIASAIQSSACLIDFECVVIDGWMPGSVRADLVDRVRHHLEDTPLPGIDTPGIHEGSVGSDARVLGAASLPLSDRFLVDRNAFLKG